jgi:hypothetical protein
MSHAKRSTQDARLAAGAGAAWSLGQSIINPPPRRALDFLDKHILTWIANYLKVVCMPRHTFPSYDASADKPGIFPLPAQCRVALAGDWGSGTESAYRVMAQVRHVQKPDITIHLGDIYYSGQVEEVEAFFLGQDDWYRANRSFALNANHEMYSGGTGYFDHLLPALEQQASYFAVANDHWRIVAVDTGYYSKVFPFLELLLKTKLHDKNLSWLREVVFADALDHRPVILLSHHQWFSAHDTGYARVGSQLEPFLKDVVLWFWGHEHRFSGYAAYALSGDNKVRARCVGHGGMPVEIKQPKNQNVPLVFVDERQAGEIDGDAVGFCGNVLLEFNEVELVVHYYDEQGEELLAEKWTSGGRSGGATGSVVKTSPVLHWYRAPEELVR